MNPNYSNYILGALLLAAPATLAQDNEFLGTGVFGGTDGNRNVAIGDQVAPNATTNPDENVFVGAYTATLLTSGDRNVMLGFRAGGAYTQAEWDLFVADPGTNPLPDIGGTTYTAADNVMIGWNAGLRTRTGTDNVFIGAEAGLSNNGTDNVFIGSEAGESNTSGADNVFVGEEAGQANTTGGDNVFVGEDAGFNNIDGNDNTAVGNLALWSNTSGWGATALGHEALWDHTTGLKNTGLGWGAGGDMDIGNLNTMVGAGAGNSTENADYNTFVGAYAGTDNNRTNSVTNANRNTYVGTLAGRTNREGENNVIIGAFADMSDMSGLSEATIIDETDETSTVYVPTLGVSGDTNVSRTTNIGALGFVKGDDAIGIGYLNRSNGTRGIAIGNEAQSTHADAIAIGYQAVSHGTNIAVIGNGTTASIDPGTDGVTALGSGLFRYSEVHAESYSAQADATAAADMEFVADAGTDANDRWRVQAADSGAFTISSFATGAYVDIISAANNGDVTVAGDVNVNSDGRLKEQVESIGDALGILEKVEGKTYHWKPETGRDERTHYGLIAQEVEAAVPELVSTRERDGIKSVNYQGFVPILINAVGELKEQNKLQQEANQRQQEEIKLLHEQIALQQQLLEKLAAR